MSKAVFQLSRSIVMTAKTKLTPSVCILTDSVSFVNGFLLKFINFCNHLYFAIKSSKPPILGIERMIYFNIFLGIKRVNLAPTKAPITKPHKV